MRKPSIYSKNYYRVMRRRRRLKIFTILAVLLVVIFFVYDDSAVSSLKKLADNINFPIKGQIQDNSDEPEIPDNINSDDNENIADQEEIVENMQGEHTVNVGQNYTVTLLYEQKDGNIKFKGIKEDVNYSINEDGTFIAFDTPATSDIWICGLDWNPIKLNADVYIQTGAGTKYYKTSIMKRYNNKYVWAANPIFLKDGRIIYQSNLPWFKKVNTYYLWVVDSDGKNNRYLFGTDQTEPAKYCGFTDNGELIIEFGDSKYAVNVDKRSKVKLD